MKKSIEINEAHYIESATTNEHEHDTIIIRCAGETNMLEMIEHIKKFNRTIH